MFLEISTIEPDCQPVGVEIARQFAARWPCIIDDANGHLFTIDKLARRFVETASVWPLDPTDQYGWAGEQAGIPYRKWWERHRDH